MKSRNIGSTPTRRCCGGDDFGVVEEAVDHGGEDVVAETLPQLPKGLLLATVSEARQ
jgi:hypothetical protein